MSVEVENTSGAVLITIRGDFDMQTAHEPHDVVSALLERGDLTGVVVDLSAVDFVDSTGLGGLVRLKQEADAHAVPVRLRGLGRRLRTLFEMTGLVHEFTIEQGT